MTDGEPEIDQNDREEGENNGCENLDKAGASEQEQIRGDSDGETSSGEDTEGGSRIERVKDSKLEIVGVASDALMTLSGTLIGVELGLYHTIRYTTADLTLNPIFWEIFGAFCAVFAISIVTKLAYLMEKKE